MANIRVRGKKGARTYQVRHDGLPAKTFSEKKLGTEARTAARLYAAELDRKKMLGALYVAPPESLQAFYDGFMQRKQAQGCKPSTIKDLREVSRHLSPLMPLAIPTIRRADVEDIIVHVALKAPRRAQKTLALAKAVFRDAMARGQHIDGGILAIPYPKYKERPPMFLTEQQVWDLAAAVRARGDEFVWRIVPIAAFTGMRQGELFDLRDKDLSLDDGYLLVREGKTAAAPRKVALGPELVKLFREQLMARPHSDFVFPTEHRGVRHDKNNFMHKYFRPAVKIAKLEGLRFHDLRHTAVSLMAKSEWPAEVIAVQIGHKDGGALLRKRYLHVFPDTRKKLAASFDSAVRTA